jgi:hypothetical protein
MLPKEYNWLLAHPEIEAEYSGEYIAIVGEEVVAHGRDFRQVLEEAEKISEELFIHKVPSSGKDLVV